MSSDARTRVHTDPRISRRRRAVERSRKKRLLTRSTAAVIVALMVWGAFFSPVFAVRNVKVVGGRHETGSEIAAAASLSRSDNLLRLPTAEVAAAAEGLPWVKSATVDRVLPGTLRVKVVERDPFMLLSLGAAGWQIDSTGHVLAPAPKKGPHLPILEAVQAANISPGTRLHTPEVKAVLRVFRSLGRRLRARVAAVLAPSVERVTLSLRDGTAIRYGAPEDLNDKNRALSAVLARLKAEGRTPSYIDVRVPSSPAVSLAAAIAPTAPAASPAPTSTP